MAKKTALNAAKMKDRNFRLVLEQLRISPFSRSQLARRTGLTRAAISLIVDSLLQSQILVEGKIISSKSAGRSATELHWNKDAFHCIGVVIRRSYFAVGLYDFCGGKLHVERRNIAPDYNSADAVMGEIFSMIRRCFTIARPAGRFLGIGIGAPGPIDADLGIIDNPTNLEFLHKAPIVHPLEKQFRCPVIMINDACAHALAELSYGVKDKYDNFLVMEVTGGIGAGLVLDGKLISGSFGNGNEIGHTTINLDGERCSCGNIGCAELYTSLDFVVQRAQKLDSRLNRWQDIVDYAISGLPVAVDIVKQQAYCLATLSINMLNLLNLNAIIFNGLDICYQPELLLSLIEEQIPARLLHKKYRSVDFLASSITEDADTLSAANLAIEHFIREFEADFSPAARLAMPAMPTPAAAAKIKKSIGSAVL